MRELKVREDIAIKLRASNSDEVDLTDMSIKNDEMPEIASAIHHLRPNVKRVFLQKNQIGDSGARAIEKEFASLANLEQLDMQDNALGEDGIKAILTLKILHHPTMIIALHGNKIIDTSEVQKWEESIRRFAPRI